LPNASWIHETENDQALEENWLFRLRRERYRSRLSGQTHDYYVVHLADAVNVVALTPDRQVILVDQFRAGSRRDSLETPGGLLNPGEDPLEAGARELLEETGYAGDPPRLLTSVWSVPSIMTSRMTTILITNAKRVADPKLDHGEEIRVTGVSAWRIPRLIGEGRIDHALVVQGLLAWLVSELPNNPIWTPLCPPLWLRQYRIASVMGVVAGCGLAFGIVANLGVRMTLGVASAFSLPIAAAITFILLDPPQSAVLLRAVRSSFRRRLLRFAALIGTLVITLVILMGLSILLT
jgi:8-oxo-dGTP pyrophosphatase MutT (NUDIX family)